MIDYDRLKAPRDQFGVLLEPPVTTLSSAADKLGQTPILDRTVADLRSGLRARLQLQSPVIVSGHQTEFFHAGVFAKNIAVERLSKAHGGSALFLTVDSDQLRHSELIVPQTTSAGIRRVAVPFSDEPRLLTRGHPRNPRRAWEPDLLRLLRPGPRSL